MKKIDFGFNDDKKLNASFSRISPYNGEYIDVIGCNDFDFLITRIVDSYDGLNGNIDVREVAQDFYKDGSYVNYANQEKNILCGKIERLLNSSRIRKELSDGKSPLTILKEAGFPVYHSSLRDIEPKSERVSSIVTSVKANNFKSLKESKMYARGMSMYDMSQEIIRLQAEIAKLKETEYEKSSGRGY